MIVCSARWVLPISRAPIAHGAVAVEQGRIAYVGPATGAPAGERIDLGDAALLPGLVNAHTHLELTAMRGFLEDLSFWDWINTLTRARGAVLDHAALVASARLGLAEGLRAGVTTYADTTASGAPLQAMHEAGVRGIAYLEVFGPDPAQASTALAGVRETIDRLRSDDTALVRVGVSPHAPYSVSDPLFTGTGALARDAALPIAIHSAESEAETRYIRDAAGPWADSHRARGIRVVPRGRSPVAMLERTGVLRARPLLIHCVRLDADDVRIIAAHDCAVAHCPASNAKLGHGIAPLVELQAAGVRVGLGSDSVASNNRMDLLDEARLAVLLQRGRLQRHDQLTAADALALATVGGARALGLESEIGTLDVGKQADLAAFAIDVERESPCYDPAAMLVYAAAGRAACLVMVAGEILVRDGRLVHDARPAVDHVRVIARSLARWRGDPTTS